MKTVRGGGGRGPVFPRRKFLDGDLPATTVKALEKSAVVTQAQHAAQPTSHDINRRAMLILFIDWGPV